MVLVLAGGTALLGWFIVPAWQHARGGPPCWRQPAWWGVVALLGAGALRAKKGWRTLGDIDAVSVAVYAATLALPVAGAVQLALQLRDPARRRARGLAALWAAGLALLALLGAFGLWPLALWRL